MEPDWSSHKPITNSDGTMEWQCQGVRHRVNGPAVIYPNGQGESWWHNGLRHRVGGPALINNFEADGNSHRESWWCLDELHREDGPAITFQNGRKEWWQWDQLHRVDGPAIVHPSGNTEWYQRGQRHREGGPAFTTSERSAWYNHGELHRTDGPAIECRAEWLDAWFLRGRGMDFCEWLAKVDATPEEKVMFKLKYG